jgi:DNA-binding response OmpR family regulator
LIQPEARRIRPRAPDRLIQGEDPTTRHAPDARHWLNIYAELVAFHEDLLQRFRAEAAQLRGIERRQLEAGELALVRAEIERLRERLHFWEHRCLELASLELDLATHVLRHGATEVRLTKREMQVLDVLLRNPGRRFRAEALITMAWREGRLAPEQLRTYIVRIRRKLAEARIPARIANHPREGYFLVFD